MLSLGRDRIRRALQPGLVADARGKSGRDCQRLRPSPAPPPSSRRVRFVRGGVLETVEQDHRQVQVRNEAVRVQPGASGDPSGDKNTAHHADIEHGRIAVEIPSAPADQDLTHFRPRMGNRVQR